ncbi:hypothetical protein [Collimonas pratensis]|uniref:hypothetical protein n=1 Tax=Collimonas pratensis TaxID=279113 RepID=UPI0012E93B64|nr:hypothetical protein [Collimonas pratensis]
MADIAAVNEEHILPVALGAPKSFFVLASAAENSRMNELIDAPAINDPLLRFIAMSQGVVSRSGPVSSKHRGSIVDTGEEIAAVFHSGGFNMKFVKPVDVDESTSIIKTVRGFGEEVSKHAEKIKANYAKKGIAIEIEEGGSLINPEVNVPLVGDMGLIRQELIKIAYLMTVRVFGDDAISSVSGEIYRKAMFAKSDLDLDETGLKGNAFHTPPPFLPRTKRNENALTCFRAGDAIVSGVNLFDTFTGFFVTPSTGFRASEAAGEVVLIDAQIGTMKSRPFSDYFAELDSKGPLSFG